MSLLALLNSVAALFVGPVSVHCASDAQTIAAMERYGMSTTPQAWAFPDTRQVFLRRWLCYRLARPKHPEFRFAVGVFAHELGHVALNTRDERAAERFRKRHERRLARLLR